VGSLLSREELRQLEEVMAALEPGERGAVEELQQLATRQGGLAGSGILDLLEAIMKGIVRALELDLRWVFNALVTPLVKLAILLNPLPEYQLTSYPMDGDQEMRYIDEIFENWGSTLLANVTVRTFFPRTVRGIQAIVRMAGEEGARVRASATRHTFNPWLWGVESDMQPGQEGRNVDYVISMLPQEISDHLAYERDHGSWPEDSELVGIEGPLRVWREEEGGKLHAAVRFGAATLNLHYEEWALANNWTLPSNTIMQYMTLGGVMMGTSHGGGIGHRTMADILLEVEYVDAQGNLVTLTDPEDLHVFGGSMGMLGILTSLTYKLDEMTYARFWPQHVPGGLPALMPPVGQPVPNKTIEYMTQYYSEFIQYPTHHNAKGIMFKNSWDNLGRAEDSITLIDHIEDEFQRDYVFLEDVAVRGFKLVQEQFPNEIFLKWIFGYSVGAASSLAMKDFDSPVTTTAMEAMHFQRGLHQLTCRAMEMIVPIPALEDGTPDWNIVQEVVYDIKEVAARFEAEDKYPWDLAMENRFMGGSEVLLAASYGNTFSLAIETATSTLVSLELWEEYKVAIAENWTKYKDKEGKRLVVRPHWGKELPSMVAGIGINQYMREAYSNQIEKYVEGMERIMEVTGGNLTHTLDMFDTKYMDILMDGYL